MRRRTSASHSSARGGRTVIALAVLPLCLTIFLSAADKSVTFNRDIRPILADNCFHCHGFDPRRRKAELRLDTREGATAVNDGAQAILPGDPSASEAWKRIHSNDPEKMMPPPESGKRLTAEQTATFEKWIREGAAYERHWAFEPPQTSAPPAVKDAAWPRNEIDRFILAALEQKGITPSPEASRETLIRRLSLDLTGLPPTIEEVDAFLADTAPDACERMAGRLLDSPHFGEQMAQPWLDVARYGDTHGLHLDNERGMWAYRDWVIRAFNDNLPFDQFTVWQLAGDLLTSPTRDQLIASGFNRCNVSTSEGGAIDDEFYMRYAVDRVETTSTAWLGLTMGCAACHDHKLDPITQKEFYQVFSVFNNMDERAMDGNALLPPPVLRLPTAEQEKQLKEMDAREAELKQSIASEVRIESYVDPASITNAPKPQPSELVVIEDEFPEGADIANDGEAAKWVEAPEPVFSGKKSFLKKGAGLHQVFFMKSPKPIIVGSESRLFAHVYLDAKNPPKAIMLQYHVSAWGNRANWGDENAIPFGAKGTPEKMQIGALPETGKWVRLEVEASKIGLASGTAITGMAFTAAEGRLCWDKAGIVSEKDPALDPALSFKAWRSAEKTLGDKSTAPETIKELLKKEAGVLSKDENTTLLRHFLENAWTEPDTKIAALRKQLAEARKAREAVDKGVAQTMISKELEKPRPTHVLIRGQYDKPGEAVGPGVPGFLPPLPEGPTTNRLALAKWLVDGKHPLTARVTVNRFWQQFFGVGLVKTSEDFGAKGEWPSHPELLDWLACDFVESGWDVKRLARKIVTSATYREDSKARPDLAKLDPDNRLLARGARFRMNPENLRDCALHVSGLLNPKMGGRGVRTYQPPGIWEAVGYTTSNTANYSQDKGEALYRRSIYLFIKRTAPSPLMTTFDAPSREHCQARRERTNTPLQALLTMNDIQYFEAARQLGHRMLRAPRATDAERVQYGFRLVTSRKAEAAELDTMLDLLEAQRARCQADTEAAKRTISVGDSTPGNDMAVCDLAAYTLVANLMLNLDETLTRN
jgi:hypothetical protein